MQSHWKRIPTVRFLASVLLASGWLSSTDAATRLPPLATQPVTFVGDFDMIDISAMSGQSIDDAASGKSTTAGFTLNRFSDGLARQLAGVNGRINAMCTARTSSSKTIVYVGGEFTSRRNFEIYICLQLTMM